MLCIRATIDSIKATGMRKANLGVRLVFDRSFQPSAPAIFGEVSRVRFVVAKVRGPKLRQLAWRLCAGIRLTWLSKHHGVVNELQL